MFENRVEKRKTRVVAVCGHDKESGRSFKGNPKYGNIQKGAEECRTLGNCPHLRAHKEEEIIELRED